MSATKFRHTRSVLIVLLLFVFSQSANARTDLLVEPGDVYIDCTLPTEKIEQAIVDGGAVRGWVVINQEPGNIELKYVKGDYKHVISVNVNYFDDRYSVRYKDSTNLNFKAKKNGKRYLHPRPLGWMRNLSIDIQKATDRLCHE